jgi:ADP-ribose pyrophosphatase
MPKDCHECKIGKDYIGVGGGVLILNDNQEILLLKRGKNVRNEAGWWCKPGGTVEYGETVLEAMKREIKEEVNLDIDVWGVLPNTDHILKEEKQHWLAVNFLAHACGGELKNMEPDKCDEVKWFALDDLPEKLTQTTREPVQNYLDEKYIRV